MSELLLRFVVWLERRDLDWHRQHHGPLFHKWLPDGEADSISLKSADANSTLKVWFERQGYVLDRFIEFELNRKEVDAEIMRRQAVLEGGPLFGLVEIRNLSRTELNAVQAKPGSPAYEALGKKVVRLIHAPVSQFLEIIRTNYGQYWIAPFEPWDSTEESLGNYCSGIELKWSLDEGRSWQRFEPNENRIGPITITMPDFEVYLTEDDWRQLRDLAERGYEPSLAANIVSSGHHLLDTSGLKHAFVEGVSGLELSMEEFVRSKADAVPAPFPSSWGNLRLPDRLVMLATFSGRPSTETLADALAAIEVRNRIVHEGFDPASDPAAPGKAKALLAAAASFLPGPIFRFPRANPGNQLEAPSKGPRQRIAKPK